MKQRTIVFGHHHDEKHKDCPYLDEKEAICVICGKKMFVNRGTYLDSGKTQLPPENIDVVFSKTCFMDLALEFIKGQEQSEALQRKLN
jgi:hypothetical protein